MPADLKLSAGRRLIARELRQQWHFLAIALAAGVFWGVIRLVVPVLVGLTIDRAIAPPNFDANLLLTFVLAIVGLGAVQAVCAGLRRYWAMRTSYRVEADLRSRLYNRVNRLSFDYHDRTATGQLMSRGSTDLHEVQSFVVNVPINLAFLLMALGAFIMLLRTNVTLAFVAMAVYPLVTLLSFRFFAQLEPGSEAVQRKLASLASVVEENIAGVRLVRAFGREKHEIDKLSNVADDIYDSSMEITRLYTFYWPLFQWLPGIGQLAVLGYGGWLALNGDITVGGLVRSVQYLNMLVWPVQSLGDMVASGQRASVSAARVAEVLREEPTVRERPHARPLPPGRGHIAFDKVTFNYADGSPVLDAFDLDVPAGSSIALVGATGSGKSTVARLLPRFYDVAAGAIRIDGVDIRDVHLQSLRQSIGIVFEDTFLFSDSIRNNIAYGRLDASDAEIERAARLARANDFINEMPEGYDTIVGEQGFSLSGGQRQRIAIARAILTEPRVLILDDATSSVDARMEEEIRSALREVMAGRTTIIISHRLSTISLADQVVLVDQGKVAAMGPHEELLRTSQRYNQVLGETEAAAV